MSRIDFLKSKFFIRQAILAVLGFGLLFFLIYNSLSFITNHNEKIQVPDLLKKDMAEAEKLLDDADLRFVIQDTMDYNPEFPKNSVLKQDPRPGDIVKSGRKIYLTLNASDFRQVSLPEFYGKTKRNVETTFKAIGFEISDTYEYVPDIGKDVVRGIKFKGKSLKEGDKLPKRSVITLVLGKGGEEEIIGSQLNEDEAPETE